MEKEIYITASWDKYSKGSNYSIRTWEPSEGGGEILVESRIIQFETLEDKDLRVRFTSALQKKLSVVRAEHFTEEQELLQTIQELQSLEFKPEVEVKAEAEDDIPF